MYRALLPLACLLVAAAPASAPTEPLYYHEHMEGGHSVGAHHAEDAKRTALLTEFLNRALMDKGQ